MTRPQEPPGLAPRRIAADIVHAVLTKHQPLDELLDGATAHPAIARLEERDRALMRNLVAATLRNLGRLRAICARLLDKGMPKDAPRVESVLLIGATQLLLLDVPDHAAVDLAVRSVQTDRHGARYAGLVNAVLRRCAREGQRLLADASDPVLNLPAWLMTRWTANYGPERTRAIAAALASPPPLDLTVRNDAETWAARLHGIVLPTGTVRTELQGTVPRIPGFAEGQWWVQDAAAALPARLFGDVRGKPLLDMCAAPGGKTAQLAAAGAVVTALDRSPARMRRLRDNLDRLGFDVSTVVVDALDFSGGPFDGVLLDAPCLSTGTLRRHPDIAWIKQDSDLGALTALQAKLLDKAVALTRPGGTLVYCTCSLEPEEGEQQIEALLARNRSVTRKPIASAEVGGLDDIITTTGDMRSLPCHLAQDNPRLAGLDGFYAARLQTAPL